MNTLIAVGTGAAFLYSVVATVAPESFTSRGLQPDVYYEAVIFIIALILAGNALEAHAKRETSAALRALADLQPKRARVVRDGHELDIGVEQVLPGDVVVVRPGDSDRSSVVAVIDRDGERVQVFSLEGRVFGSFAERA